MKIEELRIGNYITSQLEIDQIVTFQTLEAINYARGIYKPIPLTEQWLLKFGFIPDAKKEWYYCMGIMVGNITTEDNFEFDYNRKNMPTQLKYVHQLQNLYFALTGEELPQKISSSSTD